VTAKGSVTFLINLIRERHKISETQEVKYVTMVKTRHLNRSRPFAYCHGKAPVLDRECSAAS